MKITCACGAEFKTSEGRIASGRGKYCSRACLYAYRTRPSGLKYNIIKENPTSFKSGHEPWNKGLRGIHLSPATEFKPGEHREAATEFKPGQAAGEANFRWSGGLGARRQDRPDYALIHYLVRKERGRAADFSCAFLDETCRGSMQWACISQEYRDTEDFMPLCRSHHVRYDGGLS